MMGLLSLALWFRNCLGAYSVGPCSPHTTIPLSRSSHMTLTSGLDIWYDTVKIEILIRFFFYFYFTGFNLAMKFKQQSHISV